MYFNLYLSIFLKNKRNSPTRLKLMLHYTMQQGAPVERTLNCSFQIAIKGNIREHLHVQHAHIAKRKTRILWNDRCCLNTALTQKSFSL